MKMANAIDLIGFLTVTNIDIDESLINTNGKLT